MRFTQIKNIIKILLLFFVGCYVFTSCKDDDYSTSPSDKLAFSTDTLSFDTIFTTVGSVTKKFMVYNRNSDPLKISEIRLAGNTDSKFRMNVDGFAGISLKDVEIRAKDSMYVFVEVTIDPKDENNPFLITDSILFYINTNIQQVKLIAYGQDAVIFKSKTLPSDTTLLGERPYLIYGDLVAQNLTIEKGCQLYFHNKANLIVNGNLQINGTQEEPVILRGDRLDNFLGDYKYDDIPGQWGGIRLIGSNGNHVINHANIRNGKTGIKIDGSKLKIESTIIQNFDSCGIKAKQAEVYIGNSEISKCAENALQLTGGKHTIVQSTIAGYYRNISNSISRSGTALLLANYEDVEGVKSTYPLTQASFNNVIIYGSFTDEITLKKDTDDAINFNYSFSNSLLRSEEEDFDADKMSYIIWNESPNFVSTEFPYNFNLKSDSPAIDKGDPALIPIYPLDLNGNPRDDGKPDLGAYEYKPEEEE